MSCGTTSVTATWIWVWTDGPRFLPLWQTAAGSPHLLYHVGAKGQWLVFPSSLCASVSICGTHRAQILEQPSSSVSAMTLPLWVGGVDYNSSVLQYLLHTSLSICWLLSGITALQGQQLCGLHEGLFLLFQVLLSVLPTEQFSHW